MRTKVQWRKGETGGGGTYEFSPKPTITRTYPGQRLAILEVPNVAGAVIQTLGQSARRIELKGIIVVSQPDFDDLVEAKATLEAGIGYDIGQLHIISEFGQANSKHVYYKGILDGNINWSTQENMKWLDYTINIICADPTEYEV